MRWENPKWTHEIPNNSYSVPFISSKVNIIQSKQKHLSVYGSTSIPIHLYLITNTVNIRLVWLSGFEQFSNCASETTSLTSYNIKLALFFFFLSDLRQTVLDPLHIVFHPGPTALVAPQMSAT
jgi:hypothetical protein